MKDIVIVGAGGLAKEIAFLIEEINKKIVNWNFLGYIDSTKGNFNGKYKIIEDDNWLLNYNKEILVTTMDTYPSVESHGLEDLKKEIEAMQ